MENYFITPLALIPLVPIIVEWLKVNLKLKDQVLFKIFKKKIYFAQVIAISVSIALTFIGMSLNLGFLANASIIVTIIWGIVIGLASIGAFSVGYLATIQVIINHITNYIKERKNNEKVN
jgi:hypothetical protein